MKNTSSNEEGKRKRPLILEEEDQTLDSENNDEHVNHSPSDNLIKINNQKHKHKVETAKLKTSQLILIVCFFLVIACIVADAYVNKQVSLLDNVCEFSKTIATATIGYLFANNMKK